MSSDAKLIDVIWRVFVWVVIKVWVEDDYKAKFFVRFYYSCSIVCISLLSHDGWKLPAAARYVTALTEIIAGPDYVTEWYDVHHYFNIAVPRTKDQMKRFWCVFSGDEYFRIFQEC